MSSLKFYPGRPCPTLLCPTGGLPLTAVLGVAHPHWQAAYGHFLPLWKPHAIRLCLQPLEILLSESKYSLGSRLSSSVPLRADAQCEHARHWDTYINLNKHPRTMDTRPAPTTFVCLFVGGSQLAGVQS
jgi:hypothetical protein